jgi:DNA primase large subunit
MQQIRLAVTPAIKNILEEIKEYYPTLEFPEIAKMLMAEGASKIKEMKEANQTAILQQQVKEFDEISKDVQKGFARYAKENGINLESLTEAETYDLIAKL